MVYSRVLVFFILFVSAFQSLADVRLPSILGNGMVLQRNSEVRIWGWAEPAEKITVRLSWSNKPVKTKADAQGNWSVSVNTLEAGGPHSLTIEGNNEIALNDILFGEVWLCSGQSNMEYKINWMGGFSNPQFKEDSLDISRNGYQNIRLLTVPRSSANEPQKDFDSEWQKVSHSTVAEFSAVGFFFGRELNRELDVPIGLINSSFGGTPAEAWTDPMLLAETPELKFFTENQRVETSYIPGNLYHAMIAPLFKTRIAGAIWYQGESNRNDYRVYDKLMRTLIDNWRNKFSSGKFPFYYTQLAPFKYNEPLVGALLREAQLKTLAHSNVGMAVTMDVGNEYDIHPIKKQIVGKRLALLALRSQYGKLEVEAYSPAPASWEITPEGKFLVNFDHSYDGLKLSRTSSDLFEIAGQDKFFRTANVSASGDQLIFWSDSVPQPVAVRYAFRNYADGVLFNSGGLPAPSFRTDNWEIIYRKPRVTSSIDDAGNRIKVEISSDSSRDKLVYTLDGSEPSLNASSYSAPIFIDRSTDIKAKIIENGVPSISTAVLHLDFHKAVGRPVTYVNPYSPKYPAQGPGTIIDGVMGSMNYADGTFIGFEGDDMEVVIDLGSVRDINSVSASFLEVIPAWIFFPTEVTISVSVDGEKYDLVDQVAGREPQDRRKPPERLLLNSAKPSTARYLKIRAKNVGTCPTWHPGSGGKCWIFIDEILIN